MVIPSLRRLHKSFTTNFFLLTLIFLLSLDDHNTWTRADSISFTGLTIDRPKIRVTSYRLRSNNPNSILEELSCSSGSGSRRNCDQLITLGENGQNPNLGQDGDETKEWSVPPSTSQLTIQCSSKSGPVEWDYQGKGSFADIEIESWRITGDFWSPTTYIHKSEMTFDSVNDGITGTFICRSVEKPSISNSFYMFVPQEKRPILNSKEVIEVTPAHSGNSVVIPCRVEDRETSIHLYKKMEDGSLKRMNMDNSVSLKFNPFLGFELELSSQVYGHYVCKTDKLGKGSKDNNKEEDQDKIQARKLGRKFKRQKRAAIQKQVQIVPETSTSPGFPAFLTSEELAAAASIPEYDQATGIGMDPDQVSITHPPGIRRRWGVLGKRPLFVRRKAQNTFSKRGGPHPHGHPNQRPRLRPRPLLGPFRRRPPPPPRNHGPHPYFQHPYYLEGGHPMMSPVKVSFVPESQVTSQPEPNRTISNKEQLSPVSTSPIPSKDYFWPPLQPVQPELIEHESDPSQFPSSSHPVRIKLLPTLIQNVNKLSSRIRPAIRPFAMTSSEEGGDGISTELRLKQKEKDSSSSIEGTDSSEKDKNKKPPRRGAAGAIISPNLLPQTMNIMNSMSCVLKKVMLGPDAACNSSFFDAASAFSRNPAFTLKPRPVGGSSGSGFLGGKPEDQDTLLEVLVQPRPANKFFPPESTLYRTVPFYVKWQTESTDYSNWAEVNHTLAPGTFKLHKAGTLSDHGIHSFEVFNLKEGDSGRISVPFIIGGGTGARGHGKKKKIGNHTWEFFVINATTSAEMGLKQREEGSKNIFICKSATSNKPKITLTKLGDDGCPVEEGNGNNRAEKKKKSSKKKSFVEEDCGAGCLSVRTDIESGVVHCVGDGVDQSLRYPVDLHCTGRPFFVERGKTKNLTLSQNKKKLILPCVINNPNADVYLFHQNPNGTISDVTDYTNYDIKVGFSLNLDEISEPLGTYACTSSVNVEDDSDMVTYHVNPAPAHVFNPPQSLVYGTPPFRFVWESVEELEVENKTAGNFYSGVFAKPEGNRAYVGTFEVTSLDRGGSGAVNILRKSDKELVHSWKYAYQGKYGLWVDKKLNIFRCASSTSSKAPSLFAVECSNPNVCKLKKRFIENDGDEVGKANRRDNSLVNVPVECGQGCSELKVWQDSKPQGFVKCVDDQEFQSSSSEIGGMEESLTYFLSRNSTILTESDNLESFKTLEISSPIRQLRVGDGITFVCRANKYFYSKGFQWAIEMRNGSKRFLDPLISQGNEVVTSSGESSSSTFSPGTELKAEVHLRVGDKDWKAVWCYAPSIQSSSWGNASQLVYIQ